MQYLQHFWWHFCPAPGAVLPAPLPQKVLRQLYPWLGTRPEYEIAATKDYIAYPKPNGYRSLHLVLRFHTGIQAEIQLRTFALDFWAALEHQMKYKKNIAHEKTICDELKRCADEIASVDMSMQTLRELIRPEGWED